MTLWTDIAQGVREVARQEALNAVPPPSHFRVTALDPIVLAQLSGPVVLEEGDDDFEVSKTMGQPEVGDVVLVVEAGDSYVAAAILQEEVAALPGGGAEVEDASVAVKGVTKLSVAPVSAADPIAVGNNDPRNTDARVPTAHTHAQSEVTDLEADLATLAAAISAIDATPTQAGYEAMVLADAPTAFWPAQGTTFAEVADDRMNAWDLVLYSATSPTYGAQGPFIATDASSQAVESPGNNSGFKTAVFTPFIGKEAGFCVEGWVYLPNTTVKGGPFGQAAGGADGWFVGFGINVDPANVGDVLILSLLGNAHLNTGIVPRPKLKWHHVALWVGHAVGDGAGDMTKYLFWDGYPLYTNAGNLVAPGAGSSLSVGVAWDYFTTGCRWCNVAAYNFAPRPARIMAHAAYGVGAVK